ncbi:hypothetical protein [Haloarcula laminariae]|uniref:hypothetical protein n=1 Tax=Haloarcula laminariae TaxID=2961577 RepID=UPI0024058803|nr:hypothetical protein [Halomicroarcula sp. FL173]
MTKQPTCEEMSSTKVLLDSEHWINFKDERRELLEEFAEIVHEKDIEVLFSHGNYIDLVKYNQQDKLSEIISEVVTTYIPAQEYTGNSYEFDTSPISLVPDRAVRERAREDTEDFGEMKTLRFLFRIGDWELLQEYKEGYSEAIDYLRSVDSDYDESYVKALLFDIESGVEQFSYDEYGDMEVVSNVVQAKRIGKYESNENIDLNDIADLEIITHAIITNCDFLLIEGKWQRDNVQLVESVLDELGSTIELEVTNDMDEFITQLRETQTSSNSTECLSETS